MGGQRLATKTFEVEEFIVSANRWEQKSDEVPNYISTVTLPSVRIQNPQTDGRSACRSAETYLYRRASSEAAARC